MTFDGRRSYTLGWQFNGTQPLKSKRSFVCMNTWTCQPQRESGGTGRKAPRCNSGAKQGLWMGSGDPTGSEELLPGI
ncbi:MAG: hypothetical protein CM15mP103_00220 [Gammaproteobacteria bacterium]|nr:MAG: hypothetical protein CM15mP103_00220 [Gammaproteobacteria bacterium]